AVDSNYPACRGFSIQEADPSNHRLSISDPVEIYSIGSSRHDMGRDRSTTVCAEDKNVVVIGGTSGIGRGIVRGFADDGANVIATSRSEDSVAATTDELRSNDVRTAEVTCDVRDRDSIEQLHDVAVDTFGGVDVLVNSAGAVDHAPLTEMDESTWDHAIDVFL